MFGCVCFGETNKAVTNAMNVAANSPSKNPRPGCVSTEESFRSGVLERLVSVARYLGERMLLLKLCDANRGRKRGCCGRTLEARESLEESIIAGQRASHGVSKGLSCRVRREVGRFA